MARQKTTYRCENPACSLGAVGEPGVFTGGATAEQVQLIRGEPPGKDQYGKGVCPNCGRPGKENK